MDKIKIKMDDVETELAVCGGQLEWSEEHYITERSLKWTAKNGDCLRIDRPLAVRERRVLETYQLKGKTVSLKEYGFGFHGFVYSTEPSDFFILEAGGEVPFLYLSFELYRMERDQYSIRAGIYEGAVSGGHGSDDGFHIHRPGRSGGISG